MAKDCTHSSYDSVEGSNRQVHRILSKSGKRFVSLSIILFAQNQCRIFQLVTALPDISGRIETNLTRARRFVRLSIGWSFPCNLENISSINFFSGCRSAGMFTTVMAFCRRIISLKHLVRSAGCSTRERAALCLFSRILLLEDVVSDSSDIIVAICARSLSHQVTT